MDIEILTVFNSLLQLRESAGTRSHFHQEELDFLSFAVKRAPHSNAQLLQDLWVLYESAERRGGYFVEFGVCDGISLSNTYLLEKAYGWQGAVAEPARSWHAALRRNRSCYISERCVYRADGLSLSFSETQIGELSALSEFVDDDFHAAFREDPTRYEVKTISLENMLIEARAPRDIDYMSIDVEGGELDVINHFDFEKYNIKMITVEHNFSDNRDAIYDALIKSGYRRKFSNLSLFDDWYIRPDLMRNSR